MESLLYVCNECDAMHEDETDHCETCGSGSMRAISETELLKGMKCF